MFQTPLLLLAALAGYPPAGPPRPHDLAAMLLADAGHSLSSPGVPRAARSALPPRAGSDAGATRVHAWAEGMSYALHTAPGRVSDIALQPGEALVSVAAGDTARWVIGDTTSGAGDSRVTHVLVKPAAPGLQTNLVIATDRRVYHLEVDSRAGAAMTGIAWTYPADALLALRREAAAAASRRPVAPDVAVEALNFNYRIEGDRASWRPVRAFDDGRQVFIEFPPTLGQGEAPPLFVTGADGRAELVNYRVRGRYYVVDRLFEAAELRLGGRRQKVVRILQQGARRP